MSHIVKWRLTVSRSVGLSDLRGGYALLSKDLAAVKEQFRLQGIKDEDVNIQPINVQPTWNQSGVVSGYTLLQNLFIISSELDRIEKLALNPASLFEQGVVLQSSSLDYLSSKLAEIKRELLANATEDARKRAEETAASAGMKIERMVSARAGVFQITEPFSTDVADYGIYSTSTKRKNITVTVNATFVMQ